ncbi:MAG TPA: transposase [Planctomycetota bacterium]|nr:transposase [Planctomycetota bacterium]
MDKEDLALLGPALESYLAEFSDVGIAPTRKLIAAYLRGQLGPLTRKSVMPMAREAGIAPRTLQELLSLHRWNEELLIDTLQRHVWRAQGAGDSVATILETWCPKKGRRTPGVDLQRFGSSGRTRNCVLLLHLGFSSSDFNCILDNAIYLPKPWADSPERRAAARIPEAVTYRSRGQIALDLLDRAAGNGLRFGWVTFGPDYSGDATFLKELEGRGYRYVAPRAPAKEGERSFGNLGPWMTNSENGLPQESVLRVARAGDDNAHAFDQRRREIGLDHFEVRTYQSLLRHLALSAASVLFLEERVRRAGARRDRPQVKSRAL